MKIDLFSIGKFTIHGYGLMIAIGILCCVAMASYRAKKNGLDQEAIVDIGIYGVIGGFLGAKILYVIVEFKTFINLFIIVWIIPSFVNLIQIGRAHV